MGDWITETDEIARKIKEKKKNKFEDISNQFTQHTYLDKILKNCSNHFQVDYKEWYNKLDQNDYIIGFENGVYDLNTSKFRNAYPGDYVSNSTNLQYIPYHESMDENIKEIQLFISQILPNEKIRKYQMKRFASCLKGGNDDTIFDILHGGGGNGKSKLIELIQKQFGDY